jgi:type I restriction enzyme S subunit
MIENFTFVSPPDEVVVQAQKVLEPAFEIIQKHSEENEMLGKIRDTLLPKLMSGEIRVPVEQSEPALF